MVRPSSSTVDGPSTNQYEGIINMTPHSAELADRVAIVTGAASGIGRAVAHALGSRGATVVCADVSTRRAVTAAEIQDLGGTALDHELDVTSLSSWSALVSSVVASEGRLDVLGNVAGVLARGADTAVDLSEDDWDRLISVNLKGSWLGMRAVIPAMIDTGAGRIISIASLAAYKGQPNLLAYSTSKGGIVAMTQQVAVEYAHQNILVNAIAPGVIDTPILGDMTSEMKSVYADAHLIKRLGTPEEVAAMFCYLTHPDTSMVTGQTFRLDGGASTS